MAPDNSEIVRLAYERLNRGDVEGLVELCDYNFVIDMSERVFNPDSYRGPNGIRRFYEGVRAAWDSYRWDVQQTHVAGDVVVAMLHCEGRGREGGPEVSWDVAWLWRIEQGTPVYVRFYRDRADALEAAGLPE